jgi:di/tricarboxylate transporter
MGLSGHEWHIYAYNALANAAFGFAGYLLLGGWRLFRKADSPPCDQSAGAANGVHSGSKRPRLTTRHWITLAVIAARVLSVVAGKVHVGLGAFAGAAVLSLLRLADERETFLKIPWSVIVMICGVSVLTSLLGNTGGTRRFAELIDTISTPRTVTGVLAFVTGIISIYSSTTGVVLPAFLPMVKDLAASQPGTSTLSLALAVLIGGNLVDMSPLSTIGALCVAGTPESVDRRVLFNQLLAWGFALAVLGSLGCWIFLGHL